MTIETKYSIGDEVFVVMDNEIFCREIQSISVGVGAEDSPNIHYKIYASDFDGKETRHESQLFPTMEALIENMKEKAKQNNS